MIMLAASVLPEFGHLIASAPGKSIEDQFKALLHHFSTSSPKARPILLSAFAKMTKHDQTLIPKVLTVFDKFKTNWDEDLQQRCVEYERLLIQASNGQFDLFSQAFDDLPTYPESMQVESVLMKRMGEIKNSKGFTTGKSEEEKKGSEESPQRRAIVSAALSSVKQSDTLENKSLGSLGNLMEEDLLFGIGSTP